MMPSFLQAARSLIGTPFHWHQRVPGKSGGVDCLGLVIVSMRLSHTIDQHFEFLEYGNANYDLDDLLLSAGKPFLEETSQLSQGTIVTLKIEKQVRHLGILDPPNLIHAHQLHGVRSEPWQRWEPRLSKCYEVGKWQHLA